MRGTAWNADAPVPITAMRLPASAAPWSQRAVWNDGPRKASRPGMSGMRGRLSWPTALITAFARSVPGRAAVHGACVDGPHLLLLLEHQPLHLGREANTIANAETGGALLEVIEQHRLRGEELRPVARRERVGVGVVGGVDAAAGVGVLQPGAAHVGILLDHRVGDARLAEAMRGENPRHSRADDHHVEAGALLRRDPFESLGAGRVRFEAHLAQQKLQVVVADRVPDQKARHVAHLLRQGPEPGCSATVRKRGNHRHSARPHLGLLFLGEAHLRIAPHRARTDRSLQQALIPGQVDQRDQQRRNAGMFERGCNALPVSAHAASVGHATGGVKQPPGRDRLPAPVRPAPGAATRRFRA